MIFKSLLAAAILVLTPALAAAQSFPVTVEHALGSTTIPAPPVRVIALMDRDVDTLLALGVKPVAVRSWYNFEAGAGPWSVGLFGDDKPVVWQGRELNYEAIAAQNPDLIINANSGGDAEEYAKLSQIAPTIPLPKGDLPWGSTTQSTTLAIAEALGRKADGEKLLADLAAYLAAQKAANPQFAGKTANYLDVHQGGLTIYAKDQIINKSLYDLGFSPIAAVTDLPADTTFLTGSDEQAAAFDADILVIYPFGLSREEMLAAHPTLDNLPSFQNGGAVILDDLGFSTASVLSIPYAIDKLVPQFNEALK